MRGIRWVNTGSNRTAKQGKAQTNQQRRPDNKPQQPVTKTIEPSVIRRDNHFFFPLTCLGADGLAVINSRATETGGHLPLALSGEWTHRRIKVAWALLFAGMTVTPTVEHTQ